MGASRTSKQATMSESRDSITYMAKLAEQAERYQEMVDFMKQIAAMNEELTVEERNLLSVAYKNVTGSRRASWRIISSIEQREENKGNTDHVERIREYRGKVEKELSEICQDILDVLDKHLIPSAEGGECKVLPQDEGRLLPVHGRVFGGRGAQGRGREFARGLPGGVGRGQRGAAADAPHSLGLGAQLQRVLLRDSELALQGVPAGQAGV